MTALANVRLALRGPIRKLRKLFGREPSRFLAENPKYKRCQIGAWKYGEPAVPTWGEDATLRIGKFCSFAPGVKILLGGEHCWRWVTTFPFNVLFEEARDVVGHPRSKGNVTIGHDVWIGLDAMILSGVTIGNGAAIGVCAVVAKDVRPYEIVAGNPAHHIRFRFPEDTRRALNEIAWWNWPMEEVVAALPLMMTDNLQEFLDR